MHGYHVAGRLAGCPLPKPPCYSRRHRFRLPRRHAYSDADLAQFSGGEGEDLYAGLNWVQQNAEELERQAALEALEAEQAQSVGLEVRGRVPAAAVEIEEDDPQRYSYHSKLALAGTDATRVEEELAKMARAGLPPGPRAYHALVFAHVKSGTVEGALEAIRREVKSGIQPLPESYAAVVAGYVARGDLDMAAAVLASNRRSGVDATLSWLALTAAMFRAGREERAMALLEQGEAEGRQPDVGLYAQLIAYLCQTGDIDGAEQRLLEMKERGMQAEGRHYSPIIDYYAVHDRIQEAEALTDRAVASPTGELPQATLNLVLQAYMRQALPAEELRAKLEQHRRWRRMCGLQDGAQTCALLMEAALRMRDLQGALSHWAAITHAPNAADVEAGVAWVSDEAIGRLTEELSHADLPLELSQVFRVLEMSKRHPGPGTYKTDPATGCSHVAVWFHRRLVEGRLVNPDEQLEVVEAEAEGEKPSFTVVDGVKLDAATLKVLNERGMPAALSKLTVREIRAELTARRQPTYGNKKDLLNRLQRARKAPEQEEDTASKVAQQDSMYYASGLLLEWEDGILVRDTRVPLAFMGADSEDEEEDQVEAAEGDEEEEEEEEGTKRRRRRRRRRAGDEEEEEDQEEEDDMEEAFDAAEVEFWLWKRVRHAAKLAGRLSAEQLDATPEDVQKEELGTIAPKFTNLDAGLPEMMVMHTVLLDSGTSPTPQDIADLAAASLLQQDGLAAWGVLCLVGKMPEAKAAGARLAMGQQAAELAALAEQFKRQWKESSDVRDDEQENHRRSTLVALVAAEQKALLPGQKPGLEEREIDEEWEELFAEFDAN